MKADEVAALLGRPLHDKGADAAPDLQSVSPSCYSESDEATASRHDPRPAEHGREHGSILTGDGDPRTLQPRARRGVADDEGNRCSRFANDEVSPSAAVLARALPDYLASRIKSLHHRHRRAAWAVLGALWSSWDGTDLGHARLDSWGIPRRVARYVLAWAVADGLVVMTEQPDHFLHQSTRFAINPAARRAALQSRRVWRTYDEWQYRQRIRQRIEVDDSRLAVALRGLCYSWDGGIALDRLEGMDPPAAARLWPNVATFPTGDDLRPSWYQSPSCGRISARRPCLQNAPKVLRDALAPSLPLFEVDIAANHANTVRALDGLTPTADLMQTIAIDALCDETRHRDVKAVVNAALGGQRYSGHRHNLGERAVTHDEYDRIIFAARRFGAMPSFEIGDKGFIYFLMRIGADILANSVWLLMEDGTIPPMLLPMHDGFLVGGEQADAERVRDALVMGSEMSLNASSDPSVSRALPVKVKAIHGPPERATDPPDEGR